ncbi:MAG: tripartite tricarboxylate transporter TctB family protein [Anaerotignaceae bacterium]
MKIKIKTNLCTGIIMGILSVVLLMLLPSQVREPAYNSGAPSPRIIPTLVLSGIGICSLVLLINSLVLKREKIFEFDLKKELPSIIFIGLLCLFSFLIINVGFVVAVCITLPIMIWFMGERKLFPYIFAVVAGIGVFFLFKYVFNISLPTFPGIGG